MNERDLLEFACRVYYEAITLADRNSKQTLTEEQQKIAPFIIFDKEIVKKIIKETLEAKN